MCVRVSISRIIISRCYCSIISRRIRWQKKNNEGRYLYKFRNELDIGMKSSSRTKNENEHGWFWTYGSLRLRNDSCSIDDFFNQTRVSDHQVDPRQKEQIQKHAFLPHLVPGNTQSAERLKSMYGCTCSHLVYNKYTQTHANAGKCT